MYCHNCGAENRDNASFCSDCGSTLDNNRYESDRTRITSTPDIDNQEPKTPPPLKTGINPAPLIICIILAIALAGLSAYLIINRSGTEDNDSRPAVDTALATAVDTPEENAAEFVADKSNPDIRFQSFDWLSERPIGIADLAGLSAGDLRVLRNAIFAMKGYRFKSEDLKEYFGRFPWYSARHADVTSLLTKTERDNVATIQKHEGSGTGTGAKTSGKKRIQNVTFANDYSDAVCYIYLDYNDLSGLSSSELRILRNTIYARHGRRFKDPALQRYFNGMPWYTPSCNEVSPSSLSDVERHNISLIQSLE